MRWTVVAMVMAVSVLASAQDKLPEPPKELAAKAILKRVPYTSKFAMPVFVTGLREGGHNWLFVVEKNRGEVVRLTRDWGRDSAPFAKVPEPIATGTEQGLLGLAFHPRFAENGRFYINYTDDIGDTHVTELSKRDAAHRRDVLQVKQPYANHNGGHLAFGPDGKLYIGLGDGGGANDPSGNGQNAAVLLAKMLRIDVDKPDAKPEIVARGLRNPWRYAFDPKTNDLYIADVGQDKWEEVDVIPYAKLVGANFGWNVVEGNHCLKGNKCDQSGFVAPVTEYSHKIGCSVTGGYVYRGKKLPALEGTYFYADFCSAALRGFRWKDGKVTEHYDWKRALDPENKISKISSFGEDADGELFVVSLDGEIFEHVPGKP
jgi:glucose/arabinose dehydrogenase